MAAPTQAQMADAMITTCLRLAVMVKVLSVQQNPAPANIDAVFNAIEAGTSQDLPIPKPTYSLDGESYDWAGYARLLMDEVKFWEKARQTLGGPYMQMMRMRP